MKYVNYTMTEDIMQTSFLSITFFCLDLESLNSDMLLVMDLHTFVLIYTHLLRFSIDL